MDRNRGGGYKKETELLTELRTHKMKRIKKNNIYWLGEVLVIKLGLYFFLEKSKCQKEDQISNRLLSVDL